jgi:CheY-like chemotaxis protein
LLPALHGRVVALCSAESGLADLLHNLLPCWGLNYQRLDSCSAQPLATADLVITDHAEQLTSLREHFKHTVLFISAYGSFLPSEQASTLAPILQLPRPLARAALHKALQRSLEPGGEPIAAPVQQGSPVALEQKRVLLVEDNPVNQLVAKGMLSKAGCEVLLAINGAEALEVLEHEQIDLVLMDCNMPVMDGYEATRRIRQQARWSDLPIIALTANALPDERERCTAAGMNDYLAKPFRRDELIALLSQWLPATALL